MEQTLDQVKKQAGEHSEALIVESNALDIVDTDGLEYAAELSRQAKDQVKIIEKSFKPHKDNAYKSHKDLCKSETDALAPFKTILAILKPKVLKYSNEQAELLRKQQEERERKQREAEAEANRIAEAEKMKHAEKLMDEGGDEKAEAVMEAPTVKPMAAVVPEPEKVKVAGVATGTRWKARVIDFSKVDDALKVIDQKKIDGMAKIYKGDSTISGLEFFEETYLTGK